LVSGACELVECLHQPYTQCRRRYMYHTACVPRIDIYVMV